MRANVKRLRRELDLRLADLAERVEARGGRLTVNILSRIEQGDRGIDVDDLVLLASALGTTPEVLLANAPSADAVEEAHRLVDEAARAHNLVESAEHAVALEKLRLTEAADRLAEAEAYRSGAYASVRALAADEAGLEALRTVVDQIEEKWVADGVRRVIEEAEDGER